MAQSISIRGRIMDIQGEPLPGVAVRLKEVGKGQVSGPEGYYVLNGIPRGIFTLEVSSMGYKKISRSIQLEEEGNHQIDFTLEDDVSVLNDILIVGETDIGRLLKQPYNVNIIDVKSVRNSNLDISQVLGRSTGINIREEGGLGSGFDFSIHGLSGNQVRFFIDGIPMDNFGSSFSINNIPIDLVDHVEVYKGMVPVTLGADALGGAVNIITRQNMDHYIDVAYSYGSFNTHRASLSSKINPGNSGISFKSSAYFNYSDNNYWVDVEIPDELGNLDGTVTPVRRFHDDYRSGMVQLKAGVEDKTYADDLYVGITFAGNRNSVQHGVSMDRVFGQIYTKDHMVMPSLEYRKSNFLIDRLSIKMYASYIDGQYLVADTSSRTYDWYGNFQLKNNPAIGEARWEKTLFSFNDKTLLTTSHLHYALDDRQEILFNHTYTRFERKGEDPLDPNIVPFSDPNFLHKNVLGLAYKISLFNDRFSTTVFSKYFLYDGRTIQIDWDNTKTVSDIHFKKPGYGVAATWFILKSLQLKGSYENTYRLPEGYEMFGNGLLTLSNPLLQPEHSHNFNAGLIYQKVTRNSKWRAEVNYFYRGAENLIRIEATGITSQYVNLARATSSGFEAELKYIFKDGFFIGANITYQNIINKTQYDDNRLSNVYLDRIPNIPYLFSNLSSGYQHRNLIKKDDLFGISWYTRYIHEYYLKWPSQGDPNNKHVIPGQLLHNVELSYSLKRDRYNFTAGATNLFDTKAYDKFRVQKPGRAFYFKIRYFFTKS